MGWIKQKENRPKNLDMDEGLENDQIAVILVKFDISLSRYIFNKINKYARPTSKAGKLITDDDDSMAVNNPQAGGEWAGFRGGWSIPSQPR